MRRILLGVAVLMIASATVALGQQQAAQGGPQPVSNAAQTASFNVKVIITAYFPNNINELRAKYELLQNEFKPQADRIQSLQAQIGQIESEIQTQGQIMKPEAIAAKKGQYDKLQLDLKQSQERLQADSESRHERSCRTDF